MKLEGSALRLTIVVGEADCWHHKPVYAEIVHRARKAGLAGASVLRGVAGFGASSRIHAASLLSLSPDLPVVIIIIIIIVDSTTRIHQFLPQIDELVTRGLVLTDPVRVIRYAGRPTGRPARHGARTDSRERRSCAAPRCRDPDRRCAADDLGCEGTPTPIALLGQIRLRAAVTSPRTSGRGRRP